MGVTKLASASQVPPDSDITYTITVTNGGPSNAVDATVSDTLPGNMTFVSVSAPAGWTCSSPAPGAGGTVSCSNPSLAPNAGEIFTLVGHVPPGTPAGTIYNNTASVSTTSFDPNEENNSSSTSTSVTEPSADMGVTKLADANEVLAGSNVTFTIQVVNGGPNNAINATLNDTLPGNMTFVSLSAPAGWTCSTPAPGSGGTISCSNPSLAPPGGDVFTLVGHVPPGTPAGTVYTNTASVSSDLVDPNGKNDSSSVSTTVVTCLTAPIVTTNANSGPGSLRQAILDACPDATITFDMTQVVSPITLTNGELLIDKNLTISGPGADLLAVLRATGGKTPSFRIFNVVANNGDRSLSVVTISGLTIANGFAQGKFPNSGGGGISNSSTGTVNVVRCNLSGNFADFGGGIFNRDAGTVDITESTLDNNTAGFGGGGGIYNSSAGTVNLTNSTLSGNSADSGSATGSSFGNGGGIANDGTGPVNVAHSTLTDNSASSKAAAFTTTSPALCRSVTASSRSTPP